MTEGGGAGQEGEMGMMRGRAQQHSLQYLVRFVFVGEKQPNSFVID